jgi:WD repeat-containing protein 68
MALPSSNAEYPTMQIYSACEIEHPYPCTKILWSPDGGKTGNYGGKDLLATTGDYLRLWSITEESEGKDGKMGHKREALLNNVSLCVVSWFACRFDVTDCFVCTST